MSRPRVRKAVLWSCRWCGAEGQTGQKCGGCGYELSRYEQALVEPQGAEG